MGVQSFHSCCRQSPHAEYLLYLLKPFCRARTRQAVRAAGGKIPLSFDYVIAAEHAEYAAATAAAAPAAEESTGTPVASQEGSVGSGTTVFTSLEK